MFALNTGLRSGEIFNLKWEEVDLEQNCLCLKVRKTGRALELPLNAKAEAVIQAWSGIGRCPYVFFNPATGDHFKDLKLGLKNACSRAGLKKVTWHTFRHTFASRLLREGVDLVTVKELLGHSTVAVTMRYVHTNREAKGKAVVLLDKRDSSDKVVTIPRARRKTRAERQ